MFLSVFIYLTAAETCLPVLMFVIQPNWHINQLIYGPESAPTNTPVLVAWLFYLTYKQVLDAWLLQHSLWLIDPTRLHVWAPTGQLSSQFNQSFAQVRWHFSQTNTSHLWTDSFIPKNNYLYFPYWPILHSFDVYFVPELNPNTKVKIQHNS